MTNGTSHSALDFRRMTSDDRREAFDLFAAFVMRDEFYLDSRAAYGRLEDEREGAEAALGEGLSLFIDRPDYGFIWLGLDGGRPIAAAAISYAISLSLGRVVARLDYVHVLPSERRRAIAGELIETLAANLRAADVGRLDISVHRANEAARDFYEDLGFLPMHEERMALLLEAV